jgi:hypothetical protein
MHEGRAHVLILPYEAGRKLSEAAAAGVKVLVLLHDPDCDHLALAAELTVDGSLLSSDLTTGSLEAAISRLAEAVVPLLGRECAVPCLPLGGPHPFHPSGEGLWRPGFWSSERLSSWEPWSAATPAAFVDKPRLPHHARQQAGLSLTVMDR